MDALSRTHDSIKDYMNARADERDAPKWPKCQTCGSRLVKRGDGRFTWLVCINVACCDGAGQR